jgi:hypothetical protein
LKAVGTALVQFPVEEDIPACHYHIDGGAVHLTRRTSLSIE